MILFEIRNYSICLKMRANCAKKISGLAKFKKEYYKRFNMRSIKLAILISFNSTNQLKFNLKI